MKKCVGCGAVLQTEDNKQIGYVRNLEMDYCERCFKIRHYGNLTIDMKDGFKNSDILKNIKEINGVVVLIIDILNIEFTFSEDLIEGLKSKSIIVIFNKLDLLPININISRYEKYLTEVVQDKLKGINIIDVLLTSKFDKNLKEFFFNFINEFENKRYIFIGYYNAGKSSILNKIIDDEKAVVSHFPSTTLDFNNFKIDRFEFVDTPGLLYSKHLANYCNLNDYKKIVMTNSIKPKIFQVYDEQSYVIDEYLSISVKPKNKGSIIFYINNNFVIHRTKTCNLINYLTKANNINLANSKDILYNLKGQNIELAINGIGVISFKNIDSISIKMKFDLSIVKRKSVF